ncbi:hypothetical protein J2128_002391 [Methanomicrobium sp. W14]|uniref:YIP1 family protein n=1 Tax=Methanomicrobium sp. W14 TaxID=2817839 RepID=UPI001AEA5C9C|nr:Yip1 family protein [Methanomicrobium sp. W14]MBP2134425.1 hypothetical protein [Methanomicrobium sp. W14]
MAFDFPEKVKGYLLNPVESFKNSRDESFGDAFKYFLITFVIYVVLSAILLMAGVSGLNMIPGFGAASAVFLIVLILVLGTIGFFITGIITHIFVLIAGGRKDLTQTYKAVAYSLTPSMLIGWIPVINFIAGIWSLILEVLAIRELHEISTARAIIAVFLPIIIMTILVFLLVGFLTIAAVSAM